MLESAATMDTQNNASEGAQLGLVLLKDHEVGACWEKRNQAANANENRKSLHVAKHKPKKRPVWAEMLRFSNVLVSVCNIQTTVFCFRGLRP